jgi:hypothetical protein
MSKLASITMTITVLWFVSAAAEELMGAGAGYQSCAQFTKFYRNNANPTVIESAFFSWAQGFMSGWNGAMRDDKVLKVDLSAMTVAEQKKYLRDYCDKQPLKTYLEGVMALMAQMRYLNARTSN